MGELIVNGIKMGLVIAAGLAFMVAITTILNLLGSFIGGTVVGEFFAIVSNSLPFNAAVVFGAMSTTMSAILAFLVAEQIYQLTIVQTSAV